MIVIIAFLIIIAIETWLFAMLFHNIYKLIYGKNRYKEITPLEISLIFIVTVPGLIGCARGGYGFGLPIPLVLGLPFWPVFDSQECGWIQLVFVDDLSWVGSPIAWILANVFVIKSVKNKLFKTANKAIKKDV